MIFDPIIRSVDHPGSEVWAPFPMNNQPHGSTTPHNTNMSPFGSPTTKSVVFELLFPELPQSRLPMRVQISPHDTTDSIVTTVKNFYGLYASPASTKGVSFEDEQGNTLIARYENLRNNMVVYVRVAEEPPPPPGTYGPGHQVPSASAPGQGSQGPILNVSLNLYCNIWSQYYPIMLRFPQSFSTSTFFNIISTSPCQVTSTLRFKHAKSV